MEQTQMTETVVSSASKDVRIGFDRPFVIIGERINPTGRKILADEMKNGDTVASWPMHLPRSRLVLTCLM
jgi:cobalamin-dependent methionine synthase I